MGQYGNKDELPKLGGFGQAADIASNNPHGLAELVLQKKSPFDQMILYSTFVHISHKHHGPQRGVVLYDEGYEGERVKFH